MTSATRRKKTKAIIQQQCRLIRDLNEQYAPRPDIIACLEPLDARTASPTQPKSTAWFGSDSRAGALRLAQRKSEWQAELEEIQDVPPRTG